MKERFDDVLAPGSTCIKPGLHIENDDVVEFLGVQHADNDKYYAHVAKFCKGLKFSIAEKLFDLDGMKPELGMKISVTGNGRLSCRANQDDKARFIGNVVEDTSLAPYGKYYSIYVVSIEELFGKGVKHE